MFYLQYVISKAFYPLTLIVVIPMKFSIHFHLRLYVKMSDTRGQIILFVTAYALRYYYTFNIIIVTSVLAFQRLPILPDHDYIFLYSGAIKKGFNFFEFTR